MTIITPVLNRADTLNTCFASISRQTYGRIEHIVVDGGSTDGTLDILRMHSPSHPFHWFSEPDNGMYDAINKGLTHANGEIVAYLNSDDLYLPWSVDVAVRALAPGTDLVYGDMGRLYLDGSSRRRFYMKFYPDFSVRHFAFVGALGQPTVFWRRSLTERIGVFDTKYRLIGDCEYWLRAALGGGTLRHIPELLALEVEHPSTLRATHAERLREEFGMLRRAMADVIDPPSSLRWERLKTSAAWRARQLEFFYAMKARAPHKWNHFVEMLHSNGVDVRPQDLRVLAPARWRRHASLFGGLVGVIEILGVRF